MRSDEILNDLMQRKIIPMKSRINLQDSEM